MSDYVCDELIDEILIRLPSKSLLRFRSLSKSWRSRIDSPDFIRTHALRSPKKVLIKHWRDPNRIGMEKFYTLHSEDRLPLSHTHGYMGITPLNFPCNDCYIVGSCNGLVCLFDRQIDRITLWNPSIRRKLTLPHHPALRNSPRVVYGFGFDPITCDYKIVGISCYMPFERVAQESLVYTMNTGTWRVIASPITKFTFSRCVCFVNGTLHWIVTDLHNVGKNCYIISFDLSTEVFGKVLLPEPSWEARDLTIIKGSLAVVTGECHNPMIWARRKVNDIESWSVLFKLEALPCEGGLRRVLQLTTNGDLVVLTTNEGYKVYNPVTGVRSRLVKFEARWYKLEMETYAESLALLNKGTSCNENQPFGFRPKKRKRKKKTPEVQVYMLNVQDTKRFTTSCSTTFSLHLPQNRPGCV